MRNISAIAPMLATITAHATEEEAQRWERLATTAQANGEKRSRAITGLIGFAQLKLSNIPPAFL